MADISGVIINRGQQGANVLAGGDSISGMILEGVATSELALSTPAVVYSVKDAELLGINADYDTNNNVVVYRHIKEFYRMAGSGTELHIMLVPVDTGLAVIFEDTENSAAKKLAISASGKLRQIAAMVNPTSAGTILDGLTDDCMSAIPLAQVFAMWAYDNHMPCQILLEGREYTGPVASAQDLRDIPNVVATKVSVIIGQDWNYAESLSGLQQKYADVGTALGTLASARINQNIGENESFNLTDGGRSIWLVPGLSNHIKNADQYNDLQTLENKGYIYGLEYSGLAGVRWNNDHVCAPIVIDAEGNINEHTIGYGRTHDKAVRLLRTAYLPKVKTVQPIDPATGKLPKGVVKNFDNIGNTVFADMVARSEISFGIAHTDPNSDLVVEKLLKIGFEIVPYGYANTIEGTINIKKSV